MYITISTMTFCCVSNFASRQLYTGIDSNTLSHIVRFVHLSLKASVTPRYGPTEMQRRTAKALLMVAMIIGELGERSAILQTTGTLPNICQYPR